MTSSTEVPVYRLSVKDGVLVPESAIALAKILAKQEQDRSVPTATYQERIEQATAQYGFKVWCEACQFARNDLDRTN